MTRLMVIELRRFFARRLLRVLSLFVVLLLAAIGTLVFFTSNNSPEAMDRAALQREEEVAACIADGGFDGAEGAEVKVQCEEAAGEGDPRFHYADLEWPLMSFSLPLMMLGALLGASFIGAEWNHRTMTAHLTWEPRRTRVLASKTLAAAIGIVLWTIALLVLFSASFFPAAAVRGSIEGLDANWWADYGLMLLRISGLTAVAAVIGSSVAFIGRNTAAALGAGFIYVTFLEGAVRAFKPGWTDWLLGDNAGQFLTGDVVLGHGTSFSALLLAIYAIAMTLLALAFFRKREIG